MNRIPILFAACLIAVWISAIGWIVPVAWADSSQTAPVCFSVDVMSVLSKAGCNAGTCHGNLNGKGGLKLSLRGQDPEFDYEALVHASRGRRVNIASPEQSLILHKAVGQVPHRGGIRFDVDSEEFVVLRDWLRAGAPAPLQNAPELLRLDVIPREAVVFEPEDHVQLSVTATFSTGEQRDVTDRACYELSNLHASVDSRGRVQREQFGETTLVVRYLGLQVPVPIAFARGNPDFEWSGSPIHNFIDQHVNTKLQRLDINPSPVCDDAVFVRRVYLDALGRVPTAEQAKSFVYDPRPDKRERLVDQVLSRPEFADFWALKWADVLRVEEKVLDPQGVEIFHAWIRESIAEGLPWNEFVRALVTGTGSTFANAPANYYRANRDPATRGETTARLFLGTRLQCAKCHNHPFDRWTQDDYYRWSSVFSQIDYEIGENERKDKLDKNEFVGEQMVLVSKQDEVRNPTSGDIAEPKFLGGVLLTENAKADRLSALADWLTSGENHLFATSQVNFVWYQLMGQGLVDPIDDFRLTNPASHPELLEALARDFVENNFDLRGLVRTIMTSATYQLSSVPNASNTHDETNYSHALVRRLPAEVLLDMQSDVLATPADFVGFSAGIRAVQVPGVQRKRPRDEAPKAGDRFLKTFGKPDRILACDCERSNETTLKQVLVLLGEGLNERIDDEHNRLRYLAESSWSESAIVDELYWTALSRAPSQTEWKVAVDTLRSAPDRLNGLEDVAWALMNAKEFLFRR